MLSIHGMLLNHDGAVGFPPACPPPARPPCRAAEGAAPDLREAILAATAELLAEHRFGDLAVSEILVAAGVSRGTFYFYFDSKQAVLAELVRRAVAQGHAAASPWLAVPADPVAALRAGTTAGAELWRASAPVLRAIVENWRTDPRLTELWLEQMQEFHRRHDRPDQRRPARPGDPRRPGHPGRRQRPHLARRAAVLPRRDRHPAVR